MDRGNPDAGLQHIDCAVESIELTPGDGLEAINGMKTINSLNVRNGLKVINIKTRSNHERCASCTLRGDVRNVRTHRCYLRDVTDLDRDTTSVRTDSGAYEIMISPDWVLWGPNGGYLASVALRAAGYRARIPRPVSLHVHYVRPARVNLPARLHVQVVQSGQRAESLYVLMEQEDKPVLSALVRTVAPAEGLEHVALTPPEVVAPLEAIDGATLKSDRLPHYPFWDNFDRRVLQPEAWTASRPASEPCWREWFRYRTPLRNDPFLDAARSVLLIDTLCWPAAWMLHGDAPFTAPSLDLTVWFHQASPSEWLLADAHAPIARAGLVAGNCHIWNEQRELMASGGSQLLCVPS